MSQTTFIIGAGASADFNFPLGDEMFRNGQHLLANFLRDWEKLGKEWPLYAPTVRSWSREESFRESLVAMHDDGNKIDIKPIIELAEVMKIIPAHSIDTFALERSEHLPICKLLVVSIIMSRLRGSMINDEYNRFKGWTFTEREIVNGHDGKLSPNWIHLFVSMIRNTISQHSDRSYKFVSFNYDRVLETAMRALWAVPTRDLGDFDNFFEFTYPHGSIALEWEVGQEPNLSDENSEIHFAHNKESTESFSTSATFLAEADEVISLGFNFAPENIRSLGFTEVSSKTALVYHNFDKNRGLDNRISKLKLENSRSFSGPIALAILQGELGELPS